MLLANTQMLKKQARYSMDSKNSSIWNGTAAAASSKPLVSFIAKILSIVRNSSSSKF